MSNKLFLDIRERLENDYDYLRPEAFTDIKLLLKAVDLAVEEISFAIKFFEECLHWELVEQGNPERDCYDSFKETLAQLKALSEEGE